MSMSSLIQPDLQTINASNLPMVEAVFDLFQDATFENTCIIGAQHILPTTLQMFFSFFSRGLDPKNVFLIGKCYSTDQCTFEHMLKLGITVCPSSLAFEKGISFDEAYKSNICLFIRKIKDDLFNSKNKFKKIIILDDGGKFIKIVMESFGSETLNMIGVEQTTAGYEELKQIKLSFPVVNVARSKAKIQYESPLIATTLAQQLYAKFAKKHPSSERMLIVGNGAIGKAMFNFFKHDFSVDCFDTDPSKSTIQHKNLKQTLSNYDLIIGCTGKPFLKYSDTNLLKKGVMLISASSSDREFSAFEFQKRHVGHLDCHDDFEIDGIKIINCGFPVNFGKDASVTDPPVFQLTRSLLCAAILSAFINDFPNRLIPLNERLQQSIVKNFQLVKNKTLFDFPYSRHLKKDAILTR